MALIMTRHSVSGWFCYVAERYCRVEGGFSMEKWNNISLRIMRKWGLTSGTYHVIVRHGETLERLGWNSKVRISV